MIEIPAAMLVGVLQLGTQSEDRDISSRAWRLTIGQAGRGLRAAMMCPTIGQAGRGSAAMTVSVLGQAGRDHSLNSSLN